jgi:hypothetical protein
MDDSGQEPEFPERGHDKEAHERYVSMLLERLACLEQETHPSGGTDTAKRKDLRAFEALRLAGHLVRSVAGWALDHQHGLAINGLDFVPRPPSPISGGPLAHPDQHPAYAEAGELAHPDPHPAYAEAREKVDDHKHERMGGEARNAAAIAPKIERQLLINLLLANPGAFPDLLAYDVIEALHSLEFGEVLPLLKPARVHRKVTYREQQLQLLALAFVEYRAAKGMKKGEARVLVAEAYGINADTLPSWGKRLKDELGILEIERTGTRARNSARSSRAALIKGLRTGSSDKDLDLDRRYGDEALMAAGARYRTEFLGRK